MAWHLVYIISLQHSAEATRNTSWKRVPQDARKAMLMISFWYLSRFWGRVLFPTAVLFFIVVLWRLCHVNVGIVSALFIGFCRIPRIL